VSTNGKFKTKPKRKVSMRPRLKRSLELEE
jgi:hypothetical protein